MKIEFEKLPKVRAKLFLADKIFATGQIEVSKDGATFYPDNPKILDIAPNAEITMTVKDNQISSKLRLPKELLDLSGELVWFFEIEKIA